MAAGFYADPEGLKRMANKDFEKLIDHVELSYSDVKSTVQYDDKTFTGGNDLAESDLKWNESRDLLLRVFEDNIENLKLAQEALVEIADRYIEAEDSAASQTAAAERGQQ